MPKDVQLCIAVLTTTGPACKEKATLTVRWDEIPTRRDWPLLDAPGDVVHACPGHTWLVER